MRALAGVHALVALLATMASAHHHGGNDTDCWHADDDSLCLVSPATILFSFSPGTAAPPPPVGQELPPMPTTNLSVYNDQAFTVESTLALRSDFAITSTPRITHWNVHSCRVDIGWCTPDVNRTPGLVTQSVPEMGGNPRAIFNVSLSDMDAGLWNVIAHYEFAGRFNTSLTEEPYSVSAGFLLTVLPRQILLTVVPAVVTLITAAAWFGMLLAALLAAFAGVARDHWVLRAASPMLLLLVALGAFVCFAAVLLFLPTDSSAVCQARPFVLCAGYDLVLAPLGLKTWRVAVIFDTASFRRVAIPDRQLLAAIAVMVACDAALLLAWALADPLAPGNVPSLANPAVVYTAACVSRNQRAWEAAVIAMHLAPLLCVAVVARRVRLHFARRTASMLGVRDEMRMAYFNESESISLSLVSLLFVSVFALALQFSIQDSPTAQTLMVCGGIVWSAFFTTAVLFGPKLAAFCAFESDGVTRRSSLFKSLASSAGGVSTTTDSFKKSKAVEDDFALL